MFNGLKLFDIDSLLIIIFSFLLFLFLGDLLLSLILLSFLILFYVIQLLSFKDVNIYV